MSKTDILILSPTRMQYHTNHTTGAHINHPPHLAILHPPAHPRASCPQVPPPTFPSTFWPTSKFSSTFINFCTCARIYSRPTPLQPHHTTTRPTSLASQYQSPGVLSALLE